MHKVIVGAPAAFSAAAVNDVDPASILERANRALHRTLGKFRALGNLQNTRPAFTEVVIGLIGQHQKHEALDGVGRLRALQHEGH